MVHELPAVGQGLQDHPFVPIAHTRSSSVSDRRSFYGSQEAMDTALQQWKRDRTGPWSKYECEILIGYFKSDIITTSPEFKDLPVTAQNFLSRETVPHYELYSHLPIHFMMPGFPSELLNYNCMVAFPYNTQARGEVTLQSVNPDIPLRFDPKFLSHPYDRRVTIEALREVLKVVKHPLYAKDTVADILGPERTGSDEYLLGFCKENISSSWHMTGTVKMGRTEDADTVVDNNFRVVGVSGLRVADMSVLPILPNGHTQVPAYITGATCAEKLIEEYNLD